ncbi:MAG TPA: rhomboid family intramembrane serine protease [Thermoanaerobaculia bacterium]|nr:rhomboid family intramembrane serine protease [Thermoanaerobaculia bacterium]
MAPRRALALFLFVAAMWLVRVADTFRGDGTSIAGVGVIPRTTDRLEGIVAAPLIHASWAHLVANTVPLLILGGLVLFSGLAEFVFVTVVAALSAGAGTWMFGTPANHIGASGVVFGYLGYLLARPAFDGKLLSVVVTLVVAAVYGSVLLSSIIPEAGVSWSGHFFGFVGGILAARLRDPQRGELNELR